MAKFEAELPTELIKQFERLNLKTDEMLGEMVKAGATVTLEVMRSKIPRGLRESLTNSNYGISRVYKTPSDDGINCQVQIKGYFTNRYGEKTPAPLVANMFEYGSSKREYPRQPFFRQSFNKKYITEAMQRVENRYISGEE